MKKKGYHCTFVITVRVAAPYSGTNLSHVISRFPMPSAISKANNQLLLIKITAYSHARFCNYIQYRTEPFVICITSPSFLRSEMRKKQLNLRMIVAKLGVVLWAYIPLISCHGLNPNHHQGRRTAMFGCFVVVTRRCRCDSSFCL